MMVGTPKRIEIRGVASVSKISRLNRLGVASTIGISWKRCESIIQQELAIKGCILIPLTLPGRRTPGNLVRSINGRSSVFHADSRGSIPLRITNLTEASRRLEKPRRWMKDLNHPRPRNGTVSVRQWARKRILVSVSGTSRYLVWSVRLVVGR